MPGKLPRVFIPVLEKDRFNTLGAEQYGERIFLLQGSGPSAFNTSDILALYEFELETYGFDPMVDYVALTGPTIYVALFYAAVHKKYQQVKTLLFDARNNKYSERVVKIGTADRG